jgi:hypothetical protein
VAVALAPSAFRAASPTPTRAPTAVALADTAEADSGGMDWGDVLGIGAMVVGLLLTVAAGVAVIVLWRKE